MSHVRWRSWLRCCRRHYVLRPHNHSWKPVCDRAASTWWRDPSLGQVQEFPQGQNRSLNGITSSEDAVSSDSDGVEQVTVDFDAVEEAKTELKNTLDEAKNAAVEVKLDISQIEGLKINNKGLVVDQHGHLLAELSQGYDLEKVRGKRINGRGEILDDEDNIIDKRDFLKLRPGARSTSDTSNWHNLDERELHSSPAQELVKSWSVNVFEQRPELLGASLDAHLGCDDLRKTVFNAVTSFDLSHVGVSEDDIITWSWVLIARTSRAALGRWLEVATSQAEERREMPDFVLLWILRASELPAEHFRALVQHLHTQLCADMENSSGQNEAPASTFTNRGANNVVLERLIGHALAVAVDRLPAIADIASVLLFQRIDMDWPGLVSDSNRVLALLAFPPSKNPLRLVHFQKSAQVRLLRKMFASVPEVTLNRRGYQALIAVQLAHAKTDEEAAWARVKALSWPPWRKDRLGMDQRLVYPGQISRAGRLLRRMNEAGYEHGVWELTARIYSGWDTDGSPTIQTRTHLRMDDPRWAQQTNENLSVDQVDQITPESGPNVEVRSPPNTIISSTESMIWTARVTATRSIREAWAAFLSYRKALKAAKEDPHPRVYEAMFAKLNADVQHPEPYLSAVPGDGPQTWPDSNNAQDLVYVEIEPPNVKKFYAEMRQDGLPVSRDLLADLVRRSSSIPQAVTYIRECLSSRTAKSHLLDGGKTFANDRNVRDIFTSPSGQRLLAAWLERCFSVVPTRCYLSATSEKPTADDLEATKWPILLLKRSAWKDSRLYNAALTGLRRRLDHHTTAKVKFNTWELLMSVWYEMRLVLKLMRTRKIYPDSITFRLVNEIYHQVFNRGPSLSSGRSSGTVDHPVSWAKSVFVQVVYGTTDSIKWIRDDQIGSRQLVDPPTPYELRLLVETLGIFQDKEGIVELLLWMSKNQEALDGVHKYFRQSERQMLIVHTVARIFVDGLMDGVKADANDQQLFHRLSQSIDLPSVEDCHAYMESRPSWSWEDAPHRGMKNPRSVSAVTKELAGKVYEQAKEGRMVVTLGGDHSIAVGTVAGTSKAIKERLGKEVAVIWVDAHADINTPETSDSGNIHGMPVAFLTGLAREDREDVFGWLNKDFGEKPALSVSKLVYIGLRDVDRGEKRILRENGIKAFSMHDVDRHGIGRVVEMALAHIGTDTPIHLSFDVDALDPQWAPSTGTPVRGGLTLREGDYIAECVHETGQLIAMDLVEVNPSLEVAGASETVRAGVSLVRCALGDTLL
ncbi:Arginase [Cyphellophora attinorum]|uniref:Arginase n=1 Tax=Cyphellophora attinorum TaxID=1664694 RepID=A0A0N0NHT7_9EURO|nr:Arginase [Phialophora attinorum]KPI34948.1 Arginase [Phialophora attinorum]